MEEGNNLSDINFAELENKKRWNFYDEKIAIARSLGYNYVSEALYIMFFVKKHSIEQIRIMFEYQSIGGITASFRAFGWKFGPHGGARNFAQLFDHVQEIRKDFAHSGETLQEYSRRKAIEYGVSYCAIRNCITKRTWKNI